MKEKVFIAMSGGVDSSLCAILLKEQGYEVVGVTMQVWPQAKDDFKSCCSLDAVEDARRVAARIDIPHYVLNYRDNFARSVIDYFCQAYVAGKTPNPCIACNRYIKFELLLNQVLSLGGQKLATGHYARIGISDSSKYHLYTAVDKQKDQSYFLAYMTQFQLAHTLFPLGEMQKTEVRDLARQYGLLVADKPDSQEICFVTQGVYHEFVEDYLQLEHQSGEIRFLNGKVVGHHEGIHRYTIGQRHGLNLALGFPAYVARLDPEQSIVWLGKDSDLWKNRMLAVDFNYISGELFAKQEVQVKIRSGAKPALAWAEPLGSNQVLVSFAQAQRAVTPGQTAVLYRNDEVLGAGIIELTDGKC